MKILHISDFHYKSGSKHENHQRQAIKHFIESGKLISGIDLIVFSGDLVNTGKNKDDFESAKTVLITPLIDHLKISDQNVFICAGNHDVDRDDTIESIINALDQKNSITLNEFLKSNDYQYSLKPTQNYYEFSQKYFNRENDINDPMFSVKKRDVEGKKIGVVSINSAWRAVGLNDEKGLLYPTEKLQEALGQLKEVDFKILVMHHPLMDFKQFNSSEIEDIIHQNFNLVLTGHIHKNKDSIDLLSNTGVIFMGAPATLSGDQSSEIGIGQIEIDFENLKFRIQKFLFDSNNNVVYLVDKGEYDLPSSQERHEINKFRLKLKSKYSIEADKAKELMVSRDDSRNKSFQETCAEPVLKSKPQSTFSEEQSPLPNFDWENLNNESNDIHVFGHGKCGKTILLKKILLDLLDDFPTYKTVPYYIDCKDSSFKEKIDLETEFFRYFEINRKKANELISNEKVLLLIDNFHAATKQFISSIEEILERNSNVRVIMCSDESVLNTFENLRLDGRNLMKLYFHRLRKKHIKQLSKKLHDLPIEKEEEIAEKIESIFNRLSIPFNFWTVSLFIWIFKKDLNSNFQNDVELVNLYIEKLLEKDRLTIEQDSFGFDKYKRYLAHLSFELLQNHQESGYAISYPKLYEFTENYILKNPRNNIGPRDILRYIEEKGIIKIKHNELYTFRLNGVFEYFIAQYMIIENNFLQNIIQEDLLYLTYANEFEIYAGIKRDDENFLNQIFQKTKNIFSSINSKYDSDDDDNLDKLLKSKLVELSSFKGIIHRISAGLSEGLTIDEQDQIEEEMILDTGLGIDEGSEVKLKNPIQIDSSIESLDKALSILGRVYKNIDEISDEERVYEIFDFIIKTGCNWGFQVIEELSHNEIKELIEDSNEARAKELLNLLTHLIPTLVQARLYDIIGHKNLEKVILNRIDRYSKNTQNNQYRLFVLYYLLVDINPRKHKEKLEQLIELLTMPILKYSSTLKLNFYIGFKTNEDPKLLAEYKRLLQKQQMKFEPDESKIPDFQKGVEKQIKTARIQKQKDS